MPSLLARTQNPGTRQVTMELRGLIILQVEVYLLTDNSCQNLEGVLTRRRVPTTNLAYYR